MYRLLAYSEKLVTKNESKTGFKEKNIILSQSRVEENVNVKYKLETENFKIHL